MSSIVLNGNDAKNGNKVVTVRESQEVRPLPILDSAGSSNEASSLLTPSFYSDKRESALGVEGGQIIGQSEATLVTSTNKFPGSSPSALAGSQSRENAQKQEPDPRPKILLPGPGRLVSEVAADFGRALESSDIYRYAGGAAVYDERTRTLVPIKATAFCTWVESHVVPAEVDEDGRQVPRSMGRGVAGAVLASHQFLDTLRVVERINPVRLPTWRDDRELAQLPEGYDPASRILTVHDSVAYATDLPLADALAFLEKDLLKDFPFADAEHSKAVAVAAMLTLFGLHLMPPKTLLPVILFRANWPGAGKGLLAQLATVPVLGFTPTGVDPKSDAEMRKHLFAVAKDARPVFFLDNVIGRLASPSLESFVTTHTVSGRVLGSSATLNLSKNTLVLVTANNCTLNEDMARRTVVSELYVDGNPATRVIDNRLDENRILALRPKILSALYALVRTWAEAGKPVASMINPNFETWSKVIGGIVEHAGMGSVTTTVTPAAVIDPNENDMSTLVARLYDERQAAVVTFPEIVEVARNHHLFAPMLAGDHRRMNTAFGKFLATQDQRLFCDGVRFAIIGHGHARRYVVQQPLPLSKT